MAISLTIMSTTTSLHPHHHVYLGSDNRSGTREFRFDKSLGHEALCSFWSSGFHGRRSGISVPAVAGLDLAKVADTKHTGLRRELDFTHKS